MGEKRERVKQKLYDFICDEQYKPMRLKDIRFLLQVKDADKKRVEEALNELVEEGKITVTPKGKYKKLDDKFLVGDYIGNKKGYGFVRVEGYKDDFFIPAKFSMGAFHGDRVMIAPDSYTKQGKSTEAKVTQILKRYLVSYLRCWYCSSFLQSLSTVDTLPVLHSSWTVSSVSLVCLVSPSSQCS